jgi:hypothetical protein
MNEAKAHAPDRLRRVPPRPAPEYRPLWTLWESRDGVQVLPVDHPRRDTQRARRGSDRDARDDGGAGEGNDENEAILMQDLKCYLCGNSKLVAFKFDSENRGESVALVCTDCGLVVYNIDGHVKTAQDIPPEKYLKPIKDEPTLNKLKRAEETITALRKYQDELHEMIRDLKKR